MITEVTELLSESIIKPGQSNISKKNIDYTPERMHRIIDLNDRVIQRKLNNGQYTQAETLLKQLQTLIKETNYGELKATMLYQKSISDYNLACVYQKLWKNQDCRFHLEKSIECQKLQILQYQKPEIRIEKEIQLIKCYLQYCAVLSQLGNHEQSLQISKKIIKNQRDIFSACYHFCQDYYKNNQTSPESKPGQKIKFQQFLINQAHSKLKDLAYIPLADDLLNQHRDKFQSISQSIYFWKNCPENNQKLIRKELGINNPDSNSSSRNLLGIKKNEEWIENFNIGCAMIMKPRIIDIKNKIEPDFLSLISPKALLEQIFYTSIAYFTIATQIRFKEVDNQIKKLKDNEKAIKISENQYIKICKIFHLKAIELVGKYVSNSSQYINHLILSFNKNYKIFMDAIHEQSYISQSIITRRNENIKIEQNQLSKINPQQLDILKNARIVDQNQQILKDQPDQKQIRKRSTTERVRSNTKDSHNSKRKTTFNVINKRNERIKSTNHRIQRLKSEERPIKKHEQIKTFTFKFVKEIKESVNKRKKQKKKVSKKYL